MASILLFAALALAAVVALAALLACLAVLAARTLRKADTARAARRAKRSLAAFAVASLACLGFAAFTQLTASTPPILDERGDVLEGSVAELRAVELNGRDEWISQRGRDAGKPVLLFLAGGPGGSQMAAVREELAGLEEHFVVAVWDQPGAGKSYDQGGAGLDVDTYVQDGLALTEHLCERFGQEKVYLVGESWGSALGVFMAAERPERFHALIGTGQMVDFLETENRDYDLALALAEEAGDAAKVERLESIGRPPYHDDVALKSGEYLNYLHARMAGDPGIDSVDCDTVDSICAPEYGIVDKVNFVRGIVDTFGLVYPQLYGVDLREDYPRLDVPVHFFLGRHDMNAPTDLAQEYLDVLEAPRKELVWFERSGHNPWASESERFVEEVVRVAGLTQEQ